MKTLIVNLPLLLLFLIVTPILSQSESVRVKVVGVIDGDTITVMTKEKTQKQVRIKGIDAPEKAQAFGSDARQKLSELLLDKNVVLEYSKIRANGETLGKVFFKGKDIGLEMLQGGFAWCDDEQEELLDARDSESYCSTEKAARRQSFGLWRDESAEPPWEFRKRYVPEDEIRYATIKTSTTFEGRVMEIIDGASIAIAMSDNSRLAICISRLETPEPGQPYADVAEQHLKDLLLQKNVRVTISGFPEDENCISGDVYLNDVNVNLQMVRDGVAWANKNYYYPEGYYTYEAAEQAARSERRGIWQDSSPMAPWEYRAQTFRSESWQNNGAASGFSYGGYTAGSTGDGNRTVRVRGYYRSNGTYVRSHTRSAPGSGGGRSGSSGGRRR